MIKLDLAAAVRTYRLLWVSQMMVYGPPALAVGVILFFLFMLGGVINPATILLPVLAVGVIVAGVSMLICLVGTASDLIFLMLKAAVWCIAYALSRTTNSLVKLWSFLREPRSDPLAGSKIKGALARRR